jgi:protein-disulfide isomerase
MKGSITVTEDNKPAETADVPATEKPAMSMSKDMINTLIIGVIFMAVGVFLGFMLANSGDQLTASDVRVIVNEEVSSAVESGVANSMTDILANLPAANVSPATDGEPVISAEDMDAMIQEALDDAERVRSYKIDDDPYLGPEDAPVVIVEFSDFFCGFCGRHFEQTLTPLLEEYDGYIRYVYRDFPGVGGQYAVQAAVGAECADEQGEFWDYHALLFSNQDRTGAGSLDDLRDILIEFAGEVEIDVEQFTTCLDDQTYLSDVTFDLSDARATGANGTPAFLVNGRLMSGAQPIDVFQSVIDAELAALGIEVDTSAGG